MEESHTSTCDLCGEAFSSDEAVPVSGQSLCASCLESETVLCRICGERILNRDNTGNNSLPLCRRCCEQHYTTCIRCGAWIHREDAYYASGDPAQEEPLCFDCYLRAEGGQNIHDYSYKPSPIFHGLGPRYFGVELEIDGAGEDKDNAFDLLKTANRSGKFLYIKHDGSLDAGLELVTHPLSLHTHLREMPWRELCQKAVSLGYRSHQTDTCGLHVHISREAFGATWMEQEEAIARVLYFFEKHWEELLKFSRRTQSQLEKWANRYGYKEHPHEILDHAKCGNRKGRYTAVNLENDDTVEFRMFRGTLKGNTIFATLQLLNCICDVALFMSDEELKSMAWTTFVSGVSAEQYPELVQYWKERRLYVNEPVDGEEDV